MRYKLRGCPKCGGDLIIDGSGIYPEWDCLQCGYRQAVKIESCTLVDKHERKDVTK